MAQLVDSKTVSAVVEKGPFPFLLVVHPVRNEPVEVGAGLPFLFGYGKYHALRLLGKFFRIKDHDRIFASLHRINSQVTFQQFRGPVFGQRQEVAVHIAIVLLQLIREKCRVRHGVLVQNSVPQSIILSGDMVPLLFQGVRILFFDLCLRLCCPVSGLPQGFHHLGCRLF